MPEETLTIWKLYDNTELTREKNRQVENLENWLEGNFVYRQHSHGQYFKHALNKTLKINADQRILDFFTDSDNIDYASVKNPDDSQPVYYFVTAKKWIAEKTVELTLLMDTINTFKNNYTFSNKTTILRQHEDRFFLQNDYMRRKVDKVPEDLQPILYKKGETHVWQTEDNEGWYNNIEKDKFYLFYANVYQTGDQVPLQGFGCFDQSKVVLVDWRKEETITTIGQLGTDVYVIAPDYMRDPISPLVTSKNGARLKIEFLEDGTSTKHTTYIFYEGGHGLTHTAALYVAGGKLKIREFTYDATGNMVLGDLFTADSNKVVLISKTSKYTEVFPYRQVGYTVFSNATNYITDITGTIEEFALTAKYNTISPIGAVDRTNVRLQKIIELPYNAATFNVVGTYISLIDTDFGTDVFETGIFLELQDLSARFSCDLYHEDPLKNIKQGFNNEPKATDLAEMRNESKLYNSDYFITKFVYDSMSYVFKLEQANGYSEEKTTFHPTSTMNSKFAFMFDWSKINAQEDYDNVLLVSRNNELPIYNNAYMNYIRNGYNYDVKTRENAAQISYVTAALQIAAGAASAALAPETGGLSGALGVSLVSQGVNALINTEVTRANAALAQAQKMEQLKDQGTNVSGSDDIDLLNAYSGNKAKIVGYSVSDEVKEALYRLFRYYGYKSNKRGIPNTTSRYWYNFIQCEPVFSAVENISDECLNDITTRYKEGVTVFHDHNGDYDFDQVKENWEVGLIGHTDPQEDPLDDMFEDVGEVGAGSGQWSLGHPIYGNSSGFDVGMASGQLFEFIVNDDASDPQYWFEAKDGFNNVYRFIPGVKVVMTRQLDGRQFEKPLTVGHLYRLTSGLRTSNVPLLTSVAAGFLYSETATKNN